MMTSEERLRPSARRFATASWSVSVPGSASMIVGAVLLVVASDVAIEAGTTRSVMFGRVGGGGWAEVAAIRDSVNMRRSRRIEFCA